MKQIDEESNFAIMKESFSSKNELFKEYFVFYLKCIPGVYGEYLGLESLTIVCGLYHDINITTAWVTINSIM